MIHLIKKIIISSIDMTKTGNYRTENDVSNFAEHCVVSAIKNFTKVVNGQEKQVRFTPMTLRAALSLWMRCKKGYAVHRQLSVDIMPSQSLLKGILRGNRVNEGKCAKLYCWFHDMHASKIEGCIDAHLMHDELKLVNDVYWNCSNNHMVGLAASVGEFILNQPHLHALYVVKVAESVPGMGKVSARRTLDELGINYLNPCLSITGEQWKTLFTGAQQ
jgi:hypothetical protein